MGQGVRWASFPFKRMSSARLVASEVDVLMAMQKLLYGGESGMPFVLPGLRNNAIWAITVCSLCLMFLYPLMLCFLTHFGTCVAVLSVFALERVLAEVAFLGPAGRFQAFPVSRNFNLTPFLVSQNGGKRFINRTPPRANSDLASPLRSFPVWTPVWPIGPQ